MGVLRRLWDDGVAASVDLLGEATVTTAEADRYAQRCADGARRARGRLRRLPAAPAARGRRPGPAPAGEPLGQGLARSHRCCAPRRPSAASATPRRACASCCARPRGSARTCTSTWSRWTRARPSPTSSSTSSPSPSSPPARAPASSLQAYLRDSPAACCDRFFDWARRDARASSRSSSAWSRAPTGTTRWSRRASTAGAPRCSRSRPTRDRNFEALTRRLLEARPRSSGVRDRLAQPALGRPRGRAQPRVWAPDGDLELQVLRGLGDDLQDALAARGPARAHLLPGRRPRRGDGLPRPPPAGEHEQRVASCTTRPRGAPLDELLRRAVSRHELAAVRQRAGAGAPPAADAPAGRRRSPALDAPPAAPRAGAGRRRPPRRRRARLHRPGRAGPRRRGRGDARPRPRLDGGAGGRAAAASRRGRATPGAPTRRRRSSRAAAWMRERRRELAALCVRECAKPWAEADADVCEAIDFLEYYARGALALDRGPRAAPGPRRAQPMRYVPRGVVAVIAPWNFPLAIPTRHGRGRAGDRQRRRPQARRAVAGLRLRWWSRRCARPASRPTRVALLPGRGRRRRRARPPPARGTRSPSPARARSGSRSSRAAAEVPPGQRHLKRVVAEMGGKNCVIVDADADLDEAVPAIVALGVRLRRPEVLGGVARPRPRGDRRRAPRARSPAPSRCCRSARPTRSATDVPPVIEREARERVAALRAAAAAEGALVARRAGAPADGWFCPPIVAADLPAGLRGPARRGLRAAAGRRARCATSRRPATASTRCPSR